VTDYWGWLTTAQQNVKEFVEVAGKVTQEKAAALVKQAEEIRLNYDMELATSILMGTVGGPIDPTAAPQPKKLTKQAVQELDMTYVTENIMTMSFPCDFESGKGTQAGNDIDVVAAFLKKRHEGRFMIWNISEEGYDYGKFADQVLEYKFPGHPSPPLGLLFKICTSVESWLDADERNIAVIHCLTGKGRTAALVACVMAWIGEFQSPMEALQYIADRRKISVDFLTIPSQRRYIQYFSNMLDGVKPRSEPLLLRRVIINCVPVFGSDSDGEGGNLGCCPYIQLFKNGKLIATAAAQGDSHEATCNSADGSHAQQKMQLRWIKASEGSASFNIDCPVQGDILLRCRHVARSGVRVSMFRTGFHTGYVPSGVLRLTKAQLDGSSSDPRFEEDFFVDLIFSPILPASNISPEVLSGAFPTLKVRVNADFFTSKLIVTSRTGYQHQP
jgi:tensin